MMFGPGSGRHGALALALALALVAIAPAATLAAPNPHDHGFVPTFAKGSRHAPRAGAVRLSARSAGFSCADCGTLPLVYNGGPVATSSTVYAIFWDPAGAPHHFSPSYKSLIIKYFAGLAADSGHSTNGNAVSQQYADSAGHRARYAVSFGGAFDDGNPYPANECTAPNGDPVCLNDDQSHNRIQNEVTDYVNSHGLPIDLTHIYFLFTPTGVSSCDGADTGPGRSCSYSDYCAYHRFTDARTVPLYANEPNDGVSTCTSPALQRPNGNEADVTLSSVAHEHNEILTDPLGNAWYDDPDGAEIGDKCAYSYGTELGGPSGASYNTVINGEHYQLQQEYSNAHFGCVGRIPLTASFAAGSSTRAQVGQPTRFDGSSSSEPGGSISSYSWDFGDGSATTPGESVSHRYAAPGAYAVTLTVADANGFSDYKTESITVTHTQSVAIDKPPGARFVVMTARPASGLPVQLNGSLSTDPGGTISSHSWSFGDGSRAASGVAPKHIFAKAGTYRVTLNVADSSGRTATTVGSVRVALAGRVTRISTQKSRKRRFLLVSLNAPGTLTIGSHRFRVAKAGNVRLELRPTYAERGALHRHRALRLKLKVAFVPQAGRPASGVATITLQA